MIAASVEAGSIVSHAARGTEHRSRKGRRRERRRWCCIELLVWRWQDLLSLHRGASPSVPRRASRYREMAMAVVAQSHRTQGRELLRNVGSQYGLRPG